MILEKALTKKLLDTVSEEYKTRCLLYKRYSSKAGNEAGKPDLTGVLDGIRLEIEVKRPDRLPSELLEIEQKLLRRYNKRLHERLLLEALEIASKRQAYWIRRFSAFGCISGVVTSIDQLRLLLDHKMVCSY